MRSRRVRSVVLKRLEVGCQQRPARKSPSRRRLAGLRLAKQKQRRDRVRNGWRNSARNIILHSRRLERILLSQGHEVGRLPSLLFESLRHRRSGLDLLSLSDHRGRQQLGAQDAARLHLLAERSRARSHTRKSSSSVTKSLRSSSAR